MAESAAATPEAPSIIVLVRLVLEAASEPWVGAERIEADLAPAHGPGRIRAALQALRAAGIVRSRRAPGGGLEWCLAGGRRAAPGPGR